MLQTDLVLHPDPELVHLREVLQQKVQRVVDVAACGCTHTEVAEHRVKGQACWLGGHSDDAHVYRALGDSVHPIAR